MIFLTKVNGIPCKCKVTHYRKPTEVNWFCRIEDASPPEPEEFEFELQDTRGRLAPWLLRYLSPEVDRRLLEEYLTMVQGEMLEPY